VQLGATGCNGSETRDAVESILTFGDGDWGILVLVRNGPGYSGILRKAPDFRRIYPDHSGVFRSTAEFDPDQSGIEGENAELAGGRWEMSGTLWLKVGFPSRPYHS
jgi:hypothetical protein